jgi:hypothetical protein
VRQDLLLDRLEAVLELTEAGLVAEDWAAEALGDLSGVAQVVSGREHDPLDPAPVEPLDPLPRQQGVDRRPRAGDEVAPRLGAGVGVDRLPVEDALDDLFHRGAVTRLSLGHTIGCSMLFALGGHLLYREISQGNWVVVAALVGVVLLARFWPQVVAWVAQRWRSR